MNCGSSAGTIENPARPKISAAHMEARIAGEGRTGVKLSKAKVRHSSLALFSMMRETNPGAWSVGTRPGMLAYKSEAGGKRGLSLRRPANSRCQPLSAMTLGRPKHRHERPNPTLRLG